MKKLMKHIFRDWRSSVLFFVLVALVLVLSFFMVFGMVRYSMNKKAEGKAESETAAEETLEMSTDAPFVVETVPETEPETTRPEETTEETTEPEETQPAGASFGRFTNLFVVKGTDILNVRQEPSTESEVLGVMAQFSGGDVISMTDDQQWYLVESGGIQGYVNMNYVVTGEAARELAEEHAVSRITVAVESVNIRPTASTELDPLGAAMQGDSFTVIDQENGFYKVHFNAESDGFISADLVTLEKTIEEAVGFGTGVDTGAEVDSGATGHIVCIDAGHQQHGISEQEPNGPGSGNMKAKLTTGTAGCATGRAEYVVNLEVSLKLQAELEARGYRVVMIRTTNDCPLSNAERAQVANQSGAEAFIRIHCNSSANSAVQGAMTYAPSAANPYLSGGVINGSNALAGAVLNGLCGATGWQSHGILQDDTMTGINWCQVPVTIVEMGFMSNPTDDQMLSDPAWQAKLAQGMANGIDAYFGR